MYPHPQQRGHIFLPRPEVLGEILAYPQQREATYSCPDPMFWERFLRVHLVVSHVLASCSARKAVREIIIFGYIVTFC